MHLPTLCHLFLGVWGWAELNCFHVGSGVLSSLSSALSICNICPARKSVTLCLSASAPLVLAKRSYMHVHTHIHVKRPLFLVSCFFYLFQPDDKEKNTCSSPVANYLGPPPVWWLGPFICK